MNMMPQHLVTFRIDSALYGVDILTVKELTIPPPLTAIPQTPTAVRGYVNLRGQIHLVLDMRPLLGLASIEADQETRLILFKPQLGDPFGILVDSISDIVQLSDKEIEKTGAAPEFMDRHIAGADLVLGVGKLRSELLLLLDPTRFLPTIERLVPPCTHRRGP